MPESFRLTGDDTFILNNRTLSDFADGDIAVITMPNNIASSVVGKGGNMIVAKDEQGVLGEITLRLLKSSDDDQWMHTYYQTYLADSALFVLGTGSLAKRMGLGDGSVIYDQYYLSCVHFTKQPSEATINVNGSTDQAVTVYTFQAKIKRVLG